MDQEDSSLYLRIGAFALGVVFLTSPLWKPNAEEIQTPSPVPSNRSAPGESLVFRHGGEPPKVRNREAEEKLILRQLRRHSMNQHNGFYQNVVDNPDMPIEVRERFAVERERLEKLAEEYPELAETSQEELPPRKLNDDGEFTEEFKQAVHNMKTYGVWDQMVDDHLENMIRDANNPDIPEDERPTAEEIERVRSQRLIPVL